MEYLAVGPEDSWELGGGRPEYTFRDYDQNIRAIGSTCAKFRGVCLRSPRLWSSVHVRIADAGYTTNPDALQIRLQRSRACSFDLFLTTDLRTPAAMARNDIANILGPHMHRCRSYEFRDRPSKWVEAGAGDLIGLPDLLLPSVRHLSIHWDASESSIQESKTVTLFGVDTITQPLSSLSIIQKWCDYDVFTRSLDQLSTASLTRLRVEATLPAPLVIGLIERCSCLEHIFWGGITNARYPPVEALLHFPRLKSMELQHCSWVYMPPINAPLIEQVVFAEVDEGEGMPPFFGPQQPHLPSLRRLTCPPYHFGDEFTRFIRRHPAIEEIELESGLDSNFIASDVWCENLHEILDTLSARTFESGVQRSPAIREIFVEALDKEWTPTKPNTIACFGSLERLLATMPDVAITFAGAPYSSKIQELLQKFPVFRVQHDSGDRLSDNWPNAWARWGY